MQTLSPLQQILASYRNASKTEREKGNYFEELIRTYLRYEPTYADLYSDVWLLRDVPEEFGVSKRDTGIDLVARTNGTNEFHAIQCKFYDADDRIRKSDIDSFFTASSQKPFSQVAADSGVSHFVALRKSSTSAHYAPVPLTSVSQLFTMR